MHDNYKKANKAPRCNHVLPDGRTCRQPALHLRRFCRFHDVALNLTRSCAFPHIDSPENLQIVFSQVLSDMLEGRIDATKGRLLLYGLRLASDNMKRFLDEAGQQAFSRAWASAALQATMPPLPRGEI